MAGGTGKPGPGGARGSADDDEAVEREPVRAPDDARLLALQRVSRAVAHDTNNLLLAVGGYAALALMDLPQDASARDAVARIEVASRAAVELAREMLLALAPGGEDAAADAGYALADVAHLLDVAAGPGATVVVEDSRGLPLVAVPPAVLRRTALFLALAGGGAVRGPTSVTARAAEADGSAVLELRWGTATTGDVALDAARDEIAPYGGSVERLDAPGSLALRARLPVVGGEAVSPPAGPVGEARGGRARPEGTGPERTGPEGAAQGSHDHEAGPGVRDEGAGTSGSVRRALVVDDEAAVGRVVARLLEASGWAADVSPGGEDALGRFETDAGRYDVVLLDLSMPGMTGTDLLRHLRAIRPDVGIVLMSGYASTDVTDDLQAQSVVFLQKPFSRASLAEAVDVAAEMARGRMEG